MAEMKAANKSVGFAIIEICLGLGFGAVILAMGWGVAVVIMVGILRLAKLM